MKQTFRGLGLPKGDDSLQAVRTRLARLGLVQVLLFRPLWPFAAGLPAVSPLPVRAAGWQWDDQGLWLCLEGPGVTLSGSPGFLVCPGPPPAELSGELDLPEITRTWTKARWLEVEVDLVRGPGDWSELRSVVRVDRPLVQADFKHG